MHYLAKKFIRENVENKSLYVRGILDQDENARSVLKKKFNEYLYKIHFISYVDKCITLKSKEIKRKKNKLSNRELLSLNTYDEDFKEERLNSIPDKPIDFIEKVSIPKNLDFTFVFSDKQLAIAMNNLTKRQKQIMFLKYIKEYDELEIATLLRVTPQAVNKVKNSAFKKIKNQLGGSKNGTTF
jgi:DNA-directed RNA polymerase specialized sigma subunit